MRDWISGVSKRNVVPTPVAPGFVIALPTCAAFVRCLSFVRERTGNCACASPFALGKRVPKKRKPTRRPNVDRALEPA